MDLERQSDIDEHWRTSGVNRPMHGWEGQALAKLVQAGLELLESAGFWVDSGLSLPARADYDARTGVMS